MDKLEKSIKETLNNEFRETKPSNDIKKRFFNKIGIESNHNSKHKNNIFKALKIATSLACVFLLVLCSIFIFSKNDSIKYEAIIQIDVNPSVEFVVDDNDKVLSIKGLNDDGKLIITDEEFEGLALNDAINKLLNLEEKTNFLSKTNNNVKVTLTTENKDVEEILTNKMNKALKKAQDNLSIDIKIMYNENKSIKELKNYVNNIEFIKNVEDLQYNELIEIVRKYHEEVRLFDSIELENLYLEAKIDYFEELKEDKINELVNELDDSYLEQKNNYNELYNLIKEVHIELQNTYEDQYVKIDSPYKQALKNLEEVKEQITIQEKVVEEAKNGQSPDNLKKEEAYLKILEANYDICLKALEYQEELASKAYKYVSDKLEELLKRFEIVKTELPESVRDVKLSDIIDTEEKEKEYEENQKKEFSSKYQDDIDNVRKEIIRRKESLINN